MKIVKLKIEDLKPNAKNPRKITNEQLQKLVRSLQEFPEMLEIRPIIIDKNNTIIGGNMRFKAATQLGFKVVPTIKADNLTPKQVKEFIIKDNLDFGDWDSEVLQNWDIELLNQWGADTSWSIEKDEVKATLSERFGVPPVSILDSRQGYWKNRKKAWNEIISDTGAARKAAQVISPTFKKNGALVADKSQGVSITDPVLCELGYRWFCEPAGMALDPFSGDSAFGVVAGRLGYGFKGIELRKEQVDYNQSNVSRLGLKGVQYINDDAENCLKHVKPDSVDIIVSCPPYFNLEKYEGGENDLSGMSITGFTEKMNRVIANASKCLKDNRFAYIIIGDVRERGVYVDLIGIMVRAFAAAGLKLYNQMIYLQPLGTAILRAQQFEASRKVIKTHQNVLVFYKGDVKAIPRFTTDGNLLENIGAMLDDLPEGQEQ